MRKKEPSLEGVKRKQQVMDKHFKYLSKQSVGSPVKVSKSGFKEGQNYSIFLL